MTEQQAQQKITKINDINSSNNQILSTIKLGLGYTQSKFPNKLSLDLHDIYSTCIIQSNLIQEVKRLNQFISQQQYRMNIQINEKNTQLDRQRKKNSDLQRKIREVTSKNSQLQQFQHANMKLQSQNLTLKNDYDKLKSFKQHYDRQINRYKLEIQRLKQSKNAQTKKINWNKTITKIDNTQLIPVRNSQHQKQMLKTADWLKNIDQQRQSKRQKQLQKDNQKLTQWLRRFIQSTERILQIRLKKLRQTPITQQEIAQIYKHLPRIHLKTITHFKHHTEFPYGNLLADFQLIMQQVQQIKFQNQKYQKLDQTQMLNKQLVQMVIEEIRKCKSQIVEEFKLCGEKREQIALEYETLMNYDHHVLELVSNITLDRLRQFQMHPNKLLNEINREVQDLRKHREFLQSNFSPTQPHLLTKRIQLHQTFSQQLIEMKNQQKQDEFKSQYLSKLYQQEQRQKEQKRQKQQQQLQNLSIEQIRQIQNRKIYQQAKQFVLKSLTQKKIQQQWQQIQDTIKSQKTIQDLKNLYLSMFQPQFLNQRSYPVQQQQQNQVKQQQQKPVKQQYHKKIKLEQKPQNNYHNSHSKSFFKNTSQSSSYKLNIFNPSPLPACINQNNQQNKKNQTQSSFSNIPHGKQWEI